MQFKLLGTVLLFCMSYSWEYLLPAMAQRQAPITVAEVKNSSICVPSIGQGPGHQIRLKNGAYKMKNDSINGSEQGNVSSIATGTLSGASAAVGLLTWNTGGSGWWHELLLFRRINGKVSSCEYSDLALTGDSKFSFSGNTVRCDLNNQSVRLVDFSTYDNSIYDLKKNAPAFTAQEIMRSSVALLNDHGTTDKWQLKNGVCQSADLNCRLEQVAIGMYEGAPIAVASAVTNRKDMRNLIFLYARTGTECTCIGNLQLPDSTLSYKVSGLRINGESVQYNVVGYSLTKAKFTKCCTK